MVAGAAILCILCADNLLAQDLLAQETGTTARKLVRGPGGYLSWIKLGSIAAVFLVWVRLADWINRDSLRFGEKTKMTPEFWNPIVVVSFLIGFLVAITVPFFYAGFPVYAILAFLPALLYFFQRRGKLKANPSLKTQISGKPGEAPPPEALPQDAGVAVSFTPAGADDPARQSNLIRARQSPAFAILKELLHLTQFKRAEQVVLDYTRDSVASRILVDGSWHTLEPMDRENGDALLTALKHLAGLNPADRRNRQSGSFDFKTEIGKASLDITTQGVPTGERVLMKYAIASKGSLPLPKLGMFPEMVATYKSAVDQPGMAIVTAPPSQGLTTTWIGALASADRLTRDCIGLVAEDETETNVENIVIRRYDQSDEKKKQSETLRVLLLSQPDMIATPEIEEAETLDMLCHQVLTQERSALLRVSARTAAEGLVRLYAKAGDRAQFLSALNVVTGQRLVRRLCDDCKVEVRVQPQVIQQLGGNPKEQGTIFNPWKLPPPEQRVDEKGREIEFPPCESCGGIGYVGRIAVFEMITLNDQLRDFIKQTPKPEAIEQAAVKLGKKPLAKQAYQLVLLGVTSLAEVQRVLKG